MAICDMFGNEIKAGDLLVFIESQNHPLRVEEVKEPSLLGFKPNEMPMGEVKVSMTMGLPVPNPTRQPNVVLGNVMIVRGPQVPTPGKPN